jgi:hypothetical protein
MKLINPLTSSDKYVYHYTRLDTALNYILQNSTLKLNSFSGVNDPRESKNWDIAANIRLELNFDLKDHDAVSEQISKALKSNIKLVCFSRDRKEAENKWQPEGLLDRGFARPSMWHHYGDVHGGVCLMFDKDKLNNSFKRQVDETRLLSAEVNYSDDGIVLRPGNDPFYINLTDVLSEQQYMERLSKHLNEWLPNLFFRKLKDWSNEEEYRWVYFDDNPKPRYLKFNDALEAVIVGERVSKEHAEVLLRYCAQYEAEITDLEWRNGYPRTVHQGQPYITHRHLLE